ncbi:MAG TPA: glutathione S-transferase family protein [Myxococcota bacterium]|nr:glutathione S-transferase family protein [Myxococcota bacterium]
MVRLYGVRQSRAARSLWALEELGVPYELVSTNIGTETQSPGYKAINPNRRIPALVDGDLTLFESMAINLYLAKKYDKGGLQPATPEDEARAVQWSFWAMTELEPQLMVVLMNRLFLPPNQRDLSAANAAEEKLGPALGVLEGALAGKQYLLGPIFTIADLNVASVLAWALFAKVDLAKSPNVKRWLQECVARPAFAAARNG